MIFGWLRKQIEEYGRSGRWQTVRKRHLEREPTCAACGREKDIEVHHVLSYAEYPELELESSNLISLCRDPCHFVFGHCLNWQRSNRMVREDAARYRQRMRECSSEAGE